MRAKKIKNKISQDLWENYFKFCFERNPFDKVVSKYFWVKGKGNFEGSFNQFCLDLESGKKNFPPTYEMYAIDGRIVVDFIGRFENLEEDFSKIIKKLHLPHSGKLSQEKNQFRRDKSHYSKFYNDKSKKIIENHFKREIKFFNYKFESV